LGDRWVFIIIVLISTILKYIKKCTTSKCKKKDLIEDGLLLDLCCICIDAATDIAFEMLHVPESVGIVIELVDEIVDNNDIIDDLIEYAIITDIANKGN
jgi:hypothetical protein